MNGIFAEKTFEEHSFQVKRNRIFDGECKHVQAFINNIVFPKTLDEVMFYAAEHGCFNVEDILEEDTTVWTVPKWAKIGDIVFFMHSKTSISTITRLKSELIDCDILYDEDDYKLLDEWLEKGRQLYKQYGGKIFAIGRVTGIPEYIADDDEEYETADYYHWKSKIYSEIVVDVLENPIDISEINDFIYVSRQSAITGVFGKEYQKLKEIIKQKNDIPLYFENSESQLLPFREINDSNWISLTDEYRRSFMLEAQFRSYYVDYLLASIGDRKTFYRECRCVKSGMPDSFVDNVIIINGQYLPVEVKLNVQAEKNIKQQVVKYTNDDYIVLSQKSGKSIDGAKIYSSKVLIIDTEGLYMYDSDMDDIKDVYRLSKLIKQQDLEGLKSVVAKYLQ